jgi:hypothetical protein
MGARKEESVMENKFKPGERVVIKDTGYMYSAFNNFYKRNKNDNCYPYGDGVCSRNVYRGDIGTVMAYEKHDCFTCMLYLVNNERTKECFIISEEGIAPAPYVQCSADTITCDGVKYVRLYEVLCVRFIGNSKVYYLDRDGWNIEENKSYVVCDTVNGDKIVKAYCIKEKTKEQLEKSGVTFPLKKVLRLATDAEVIQSYEDKYMLSLSV